MKVNIKKLDEKAVIPTYGTEFSAGADLYALLDSPLEIKPGETVLVHTGLSMEITPGFGGFIFARSGLASKKGLVTKDTSNGSNYRARLFLTDLGREAAEHVAERAKIAVDLAGGFMTEESRQSFYEVLEKISSNLQSISEGGLPE